MVHVVLGFTAGNHELAVLDYGVTLGDPSEDDVWQALASNLARPFAGLSVSVVSVDAGFQTSSVRRQCQGRRWWLPVVGRASEGRAARLPSGAFVEPEAVVAETAVRPVVDVGAFPISRSRAHTHRRHGHPLQTVPSAGLIERPQEKNRVDALR